MTDQQQRTAIVRRFLERAVLTAAVCRELHIEIDGDHPLGGPRAGAAHGLLEDWMERHYGPPPLGFSIFRMGLDDPELNEFCPWLVNELVSGAAVCALRESASYGDKIWELESDQEQMKVALESYYRQVPRARVT